MSKPKEPPGQNRDIEIVLDGETRWAPEPKLNGRQIRQLGPATRVDGFETQEINPQGKKIKTVMDDETVELHKGEMFRTVPNEGGPGAGN
jgi:hypothetical protein